MHVATECEYVAIHDAARCLITPKQIQEVANAAYAYKAATAAAPATDTIKRANQYGFIEETLPRDCAWCAQTPQVFHRAYYLGALKKAKKEKKCFTDDNMLMELIGQRVFLVDTGADNFKITVASDLARAEAVLLEREKEKKK
jgi:2-C-methyl-D-erythritol 4-phosphate cytidylyltransferase